MPTFKELQDKARALGAKERAVNMAFDKAELLKIIAGLEKEKREERERERAFQEDLARIQVSGKCNLPHVQPCSVTEGCARAGIPSMAPIPGGTKMDG